MAAHPARGELMRTQLRTHRNALLVVLIVALILSLAGLARADVSATLCQPSPKTQCTSRACFVTVGGCVCDPGQTSKTR